jgi:hypothetical protein
MRTETPRDAAVLLQEHRLLLSRLPVTFRAFVGVELKRWPILFAAEQAYLGALLARLSVLTGPEILETFAGLRQVENDAGCGEMPGRAPQEVQDATQSLLRRKGLLPRWRREVDQVFARLRPAIDARLHPEDAPRRLVVLLYGQGIAIQRDKLWSRFRGVAARRVPLSLDGVRSSEDFLRALFGAPGEGGRPLLTTLRDSAGVDSKDAWIVEAGEGLQSFVRGERPGAPAATGLSYAGLQGYREQLARSLYQRVLAGVSGPEELAAYARSLDVDPPEGALLRSDEVLRSFVREVFLGGNGTLLVNNTFVEWAAVQALKRAEPRLLVARFGVRDKLKPFSSLLLFASPRATDQIPILEDPFGSFVDVEQLSYYVWLNAEKGPAYRGRTLYLLLAEGVDEMLAVRSGDADGTGALTEATLPQVAATMAAWLGAPLPALTEEPIGALLG